MNFSDVALSMVVQPQNIAGLRTFSFSWPVWDVLVQEVLRVQRVRACLTA